MADCSTLCASGQALIGPHKLRALFALCEVAWRLAVLLQRLSDAIWIALRRLIE